MKPGSKPSNRPEPPVKMRRKPEPKIAHLSKAVLEKLQEPFPEDPHGRTYAQVIADKLVASAADGHLVSARAVMDLMNPRGRGEQP